MDMLKNLLGLSEQAPSRLRLEVRTLVNSLFTSIEDLPCVTLSETDIRQGLDLNALRSTGESIGFLLEIVNQLLHVADLENARPLGRLNALKGFGITPKILTGQDFELLACLPHYQDSLEKVTFDRKLYFDAPNGSAVMLYVGQPVDVLEGGFRVAVEVLEPQRGALSDLRQRLKSL